MVVRASLRPASFRTARMSYPDSGRRAAKERRRLRRLAGFGIPALRTPSLMLPCRPCSLVRRLRSAPLRGSAEHFLEGKTCCQHHSRRAFGHLRSNAWGGHTPPNPSREPFSSFQDATREIHSPDPDAWVWFSPPVVEALRSPAGSEKVGIQTGWEATIAADLSFVNSNLIERIF